MTHIVCFSGGHSSALVAIAVVRRYGPENVVLLNHDINPRLEHADIKRFKMEVAAHCGVPITYANYQGVTNPELIPDQFEISLRNPSGGRGFKRPGSMDAFCTYYLKTEPFERFLKEHYPPGTATIYYGFDDDEQHRINRRRDILGAKGYATAFPLAEWPDVMESTEEIGIAPPMVYDVWKHANCFGCLKGTLQHWYVTYCHRPEVWKKAKETEAALGYAILQASHANKTAPLPLATVEPVFETMRCAGVPSSQHYDAQRFLKDIRHYRLPMVRQMTPCACTA